MERVWRGCGEGTLDRGVERVGIGGGESAGVYTATVGCSENAEKRRKLITSGNANRWTSTRPPTVERRAGFRDQSHTSTRNVM